MKFIHHENNGQSLAEFIADGAVISSAQQFLQMMMDSRADGVIVRKEDIDESFFDLRSGLAGEMMQKVVNYRMRLAIVGDFSMYESKSLKGFINESNRSGTIVFVGSITEALERLSSRYNSAFTRTTRVSDGDAHCAAHIGTGTTQTRTIME